jgi:hypothetical protein
MQTSLGNVLAIASISPDGSKLLVVTSPGEVTELWIQPLPAGAPLSTDAWAPEPATQRKAARGVRFTLVFCRMLTRILG